MDNKHALFEKLQEYLNTPEVQEKIIAAAKEYIEKNFVHIKDFNIGQYEQFETELKDACPHCRNNRLDINRLKPVEIMGNDFQPMPVRECKYDIRCNCCGWAEYITIKEV